MDPFCYLCFVSAMLSYLFIASLCSPAGNGLTYGSLVCDVFLCICHFPIWCPGWVRWLIVSIPDLCLLPYLLLFHNGLHYL